MEIKVKLESLDVNFNSEGDCIPLEVEEVLEAIGNEPLFSNTYKTPEEAKKDIEEYLTSTDRNEALADYLDEQEEYDSYDDSCETYLEMLYHYGGSITFTLYGDYEAEGYFELTATKHKRQLSLAINEDWTKWSDE